MTRRNRLRRLLAASGLLLAANLTMAASCQPQPAPVGVGGSFGTGGAAATGGALPTGGALGTGGAAELAPCKQACANLAALGCPEDQSTCVALCTLHATDDRFSQNTRCRINAKTQLDAQKCGPASCR